MWLFPVFVKLFRFNLVSTTPKEDAVSLVKNDLKSMFQEVHEVLDDHVAKCGNAENAR